MVRLVGPPRARKCSINAVLTHPFVVPDGQLDPAPQSVGVQHEQLSDRHQPQPQQNTVDMTVRPCARAHALVLLRERLQVRR